MKHIIFAICLTASFTVNAQPGTIDNSFGKNGVVVGEGYRASDIYATALQKDGKILVVGGGSYKGTGGTLLVRYNSDGTIDKSFGNEGVVVTDFGGPIDDLYGVAVQKDGKILTAGSLGKKIDAGVIRYMPNGSIDSSFGKNGTALTDLGNDENVTAIDLQTDGKILITGVTVDGSNGKSSRTYFVIRYNTDGSLDKKFGEQGSILTTLDRELEINCLEIQPDGKIIIGGVYAYLAGAKYLLIRYMPDGSLDQSFGVGGFVKASFEGNNINLQLNSIALQQDSKIVIGGGTGEAYKFYAELARFNNDGATDKTFGNGGQIVVTKEGTNAVVVQSVMVQPDGKIIAGGNESHTTYNNFLVARYQSNGTSDSTFGINGYASNNAGGGSTAAVLQEDGKILLTGDDGIGSTVLVRYNGGDLVLPITYTKFTATQTKANITLNWQTATELNNSYFAVERSSNAVSYTTVAQVNSTGTGTTVQDYFYTDKLPLAGNNYYRLKQTDKDGKYSYSKTVSIAFLKPGSIQLYPNPAKEQLTVKGLNAAITSTIAVLDAQGKQLLQFTAKAAAYSFSIGSLAPGTYMVRVKDENGIAVEKFVKQ